MRRAGHTTARRRLAQTSDQRHLEHTRRTHATHQPATHPWLGTPRTAFVGAQHASTSCSKKSFLEASERGLQRSHGLVGGREVT